MAEQRHGESPHRGFLAGGAPPAASPAWRIRSAFSLSLLAHGAGVLVILLAVSTRPEPAVITPVDVPDGIIWTLEPGPGGGGGGGGRRLPAPPRPAERPGREAVTVPAAATPAPAPRPLPEAPQPQVALTIPAIATSAGLQEMPGVLTTLTVPALDSRGSGSGPGAGTGTRTGVGSGDGSGLEDGFDAGTGGAAYEPGSGVSMPRVIHERKPNYTGEAMRAKVQGAVIMEAVVLPDGTVGPVEITRSLDSVFGLDQEAMRTVKQWRFIPGLRGGKPVAVRVAIEMTFTLR